MKIREYMKYIRIISLLKSIRNGNITRKEILIAICVLISIRLAIYFSLHYPILKI